MATIDAAWEVGIRTFDTAPLYGSGESERRLGAALSDRPRDEYVVSTKVGRLVHRDAPPVFDFSFDGVMHSFEESLERLALDTVDLLYIHDPDDHFYQALAGAWVALDRLRAQGVVRAIGVGMNQTRMLEAFVEAVDIDYVLVAGRYTLLDQSADRSLLGACHDRGVGVVAGGVFNSGVLVSSEPGATYDYLPAPPHVRRRVRALESVCRAHDVPLAAAAMQFSARHPGVGSVLVGARSPEEIRTNHRLYDVPIPDDLWSDLEASGLVDRVASSQWSQQW